jgi:hypothetical protein
MSSKNMAATGWRRSSPLANCRRAPSCAMSAASQSGAASPPAAVPRWGWGPAGPPAAGQADTSPAPLPEPGQQVSFAAHIKPLFRPRDRQSMSFAFDLWSADDVRAHADQILARVRDGSMPCDGAWPPAQAGVFERWTKTGMQP